MLLVSLDGANLTPIIITVLAVVAVIILFSVIFSMWKKVPQDKAMVVTGWRKRIIKTDRQRTK